mgnify:CR=1 FL=1
MGNFKETFLKTLIWRIIATSITILSGKIISGSWTFGLAIGGLDSILKTFSYFFYETTWLKIYSYIRKYKFYKREK